MWRLCGALALLAGCATGPSPTVAGNDAAAAVANVVLATGVGAARVAEGACFTICGPGTACNPKTKLCDALPCHDECRSNQICDTSGPLDRCVTDPALSVSRRHGDSSAPPAVGIAPPLSSAPPASPQHPDVPPAGP